MIHRVTSEPPKFRINQGWRVRTVERASSAPGLAGYKSGVSIAHASRFPVLSGPREFLVSPLSTYDVTGVPDKFDASWGADGQLRSFSRRQRRFMKRELAAGADFEVPVLSLIHI